MCDVSVEPAPEVEVEVIAAPPPPAPRFVSKLPEFVLFDVRNEKSRGNTTLALECEVSEPEEAPKWYKNEMELIVSNELSPSKYEIVADGPKRSLLVHNVCASDSANYECSIGMERCASQVLVQSDEEKSDEQPQQQQQQQQPRKSMNVYEGKSVTMAVDIDNEQDVDADAEWTWNGEPIDLAAHANMSLEHERQQNRREVLHINKVLIENSGCYELVRTAHHNDEHHT